MTDQRGVDAGIGMALRALEERLRRRSDERVRTALQVEVLLLAGFKKTEIIHRLAITDADYAIAWKSLREANTPGADE